MPTVLAFGDSNTYGALPIRVEGQRNRLPPDTRWPGLVRRQLGTDWALHEAGLPGRTTCHPDAEMGPHMDGRVGLFIALESHGPIDFMTLMLGTNDLKSRYNLSPDEIAKGIETLLEIALSAEMQDRHNSFDILLICPPPILEQGVIAEKFAGGAAKSQQLSPLYRDIASARRISFLDAGAVIESSPIDGIHFDADTHGLLADAIAKALKDMASI